MDYDTEFKLLTQNKVETVEEEPIIELFESAFPIRMGRIDWEKIGKYENKEIQLSKDKEWAKVEILELIDKISSKFTIPLETSIFILSDGLLEDAYKSTLKELREIIEFLFFLPQHTYVIPNDGSWCLNYTFENDLYFGFSPKKKA